MIHKVGRENPYTHMNKLCKATGWSRKKVAEFLVGWEEDNRDKVKGGNLREHAIKALLETHSLSEVVLSTTTPETIQKLEEALLDDRGLLSSELEKIRELSKDCIVDFESLLDWFQRKKDKDKNRPFSEIENEFKKGPGRNSVRGWSRFWDVSAAGLNQWLVKWRKRKENRGKSKIEGLKAYANKRSRENVLKARKEGRPGADKMKIVTGFSLEHDRKLGATGDLIDDIADLMRKYHETETEPIQALDFATRTVAIFRSSEIADSVMEALDKALSKLEKALSKLERDRLEREEKDEEEEVDFEGWDSVLCQYFDPELGKVFRDHGVDALVPDTVMPTMVEEIKMAILKFGGMEKPAQGFVEPARLATRNLENIIQTAMLESGTLRNIFHLLPHDLRTKVEEEFGQRYRSSRRDERSTGRD